MDFFKFFLSSSISGKNENNNDRKKWNREKRKGRLQLGSSMWMRAQPPLFVCSHWCSSSEVHLNAEDSKSSLVFVIIQLVTEKSNVCLWELKCCRVNYALNDWCTWVPYKLIRCDLFSCKFYMQIINISFGCNGKFL